MPIDPSIPLGVKQPDIISPAQLISLRNLQRQGQLQELQLAEQTRQVKNRNALLNLVQQPGAIDQQSGAPSAATVSGAYGIDPSVGIEMGQQRRTALAQLSSENLRRVQVEEKQQGVKKDIGRTTVNAYDQALERTGGNQEEAMRAATKARNEALDELWTSGRASVLGFTDQDRQTAYSQPPNIDNLRAHFFTPEETTKLREAGKSSFQKELEAFKKMKPTDPGYAEMKKRIEKETAPTQTMLVPPSSFGGENGQLLAALAERGVSLPTGFRSREQQIGLLNGLRQRNPGKSPDEIADMVKSGQIDLANLRKAGQVASGIAGKVAYADEELQRIVPLVREASLKLPRGDFVPWNKLKQMSASQLSNPDLARFKQRMTMLSNAFDMLAARGGTDKDKRAQQREQFETAPSQEALEAVLQSVDQEAKISGEAARAAMGRFGGKGDQGADLKSKVEGAGWSYEPDKYEYRVSPEGKVQRRAKGG